jgi:hypothetical protein
MNLSIQRDTIVLSSNKEKVDLIFHNRIKKRVKLEIYDENYTILDNHDMFITFNVIKDQIYYIPYRLYYNNLTIKCDNNNYQLPANYYLITTKIVATRFYLINYSCTNQVVEFIFTASCTGVLVFDNVHYMFAVKDFHIKNGKVIYVIKVSKIIQNNLTIFSYRWNGFVPLIYEVSSTRTNTISGTLHNNSKLAINSIIGTSIKSLSNTSYNQLEISTSDNSMKNFYCVICNPNDHNIELAFENIFSFYTLLPHSSYRYYIKKQLINSNGIAYIIYYLKKGEAVLKMFLNNSSQGVSCKLLPCE